VLTGLEPFAAVPLEGLTDDLRYDYLDMPSAALEHYVRRAAVAMCREGDLVQQTAVIRAVPEVANYLLEPSDDTELVALLGVRDLDERDRDASLPFLETVRRLTGPARSWFSPPDELFIISPQPGRYEARFSVAPSRDACSVPAILRDRWYETLLTGARAFIHDSPGKPWSDRELARDLLARFKAGIRNAKTDRLVSFQHGSLELVRSRAL
jgi:hypothetical protein